MTAEKMSFKTEVKQLLDLVVNSLYSHKEIFLRELISNASDAIDKARYESLTNKDVLEGEGEWKIRIFADRDAGTITVSDNGIGMTRDDIIEALGTIAHSGTQEFLKALQGRDVKDNPELIGQFGVGFYSSFMVADKVTVISRRAGQSADKGVKWESGADGSFTVENFTKEKKGTDVVVHLREDEKKYLDEWEIRNVVRKYSDYIEHPIVMDVVREKESEIKKGEKYKTTEEEQLNSGKAIWLRDRSVVSREEYNEFYKHISHDISDPLEVIHYRAEGTSEFLALLYIPSHAPFDIFYKEYRIGPTLYVKRVQIMDHCEELIPLYLRFVKGVVDSSDLPLNVSRETLQANRQVEVIRNSLTKKVLDTLGEMKKNEYEKYTGFYKEFGTVLKEGIHYDFKRKETIADLLILESTNKEAGTYTTLQEYVDNMKEGQNDIYYITGTSRDEVAGSPYIEAFKEKDYEVLIMLDEIDDIIMGSLGEYRGKKIKSVTKGDIELDKEKQAGREEAQKKYRGLIELIKVKLKDDLKDVRLSGRLRDSACCLVSDEGTMDPQMEKVLKAMGQDVPVTKRILEINPEHPLFETMNALFEKDRGNPLLDEYASLLYGQALVLEGSKPKDPAAFARSVADLMTDKAEHQIGSK
ncbi:chaperone protein HtpG [bacterium BMS3Abin07]|nr:chaperone protein HtpG [bacterium BMS3Abin07]GBE33264.1 chaperone protein HtpG [bacterium BMS3Bbin05]HDL19800.1 molecular chaperone HtpG [Nitrospirota bacterium]HDO23105.1 molecular chaperone HtpG [Nitrospirota bacterium]HDZ87284.1 molecular chaperone HtpG [Nitrospirota bacterium]